MVCDSVVRPVLHYFNMGSYKLKFSYVRSVVVISKIRNVLLIVMAFFLFACSDDTPQFSKGKPTPSFELTKLEGGSMSFPDDMKGKIITVRFWADWCPFCKTEMKDIEPIYQ
ncbi:MAG TPA: redoxin domain-containing protein, partial [Leucothrix sp.]|nr:redoxin domain-containing protein [Leucothrix sp.]